MNEWLLHAEYPFKTSVWLFQPVTFLGDKGYNIKKVWINSNNCLQLLTQYRGHLPSLCALQMQIQCQVLSQVLQGRHVDKWWATTACYKFHLTLQHNRLELWSSGCDTKHIHYTQLTLRLLISYIYGAPSRARNANIVYIWTYVWQRWKSLFLFAAQCFNTESMQKGFLCHICV